MAYTSSNKFLLNVVPTFNTVANSGLTATNATLFATNISNLSQIIDYPSQSMYITTIYPYNTGRPITVAGTMTVNGQLEVGATQGGGNVLQVDGDALIEGSITASSFINTSDRRFKKDISPISNALSTICAIQGVNYTLNGSSTRSLGFIAQDLLAVIPQVVNSSDSARLGVDYAQIIPLLLEAIKELNEKIVN